jgi:C4-type Zn-finger protein
MLDQPLRCPICDSDVWDDTHYVTAPVEPVQVTTYWCRLCRLEFNLVGNELKVNPKYPVKIRLEDFAESSLQ